MSWYKKSQQEQNIPISVEEFQKQMAAKQEQRYRDVREIMEEATTPLRTSDILMILSNKHPDRWSTYYLASKTNVRWILNALNTFKDEIIVKDNKRKSPSGRGGKGSGKWSHYNTYILKNKVQNNDLV